MNPPRTAYPIEWLVLATLLSACTSPLGRGDSGPPCRDGLIECHGSCVAPRDVCGSCTSPCGPGVACLKGHCIRGVAWCDDQGPTCTGTKVCKDNRECLDIECIDVTCAPGESCYAGTCLRPTCGTQTCAGGGTCFDGGCVDSACLDMTCPRGGACTLGRCAAATCSDGLRNQDESDVDCGGYACGPCAAGATCALERDCVSRKCQTGTCAACGPETQCNGDSFCSLGTCVATGFGCDADAGCLNGELCLDRVCYAACTESTASLCPSTMPCRVDAGACLPERMCKDWLPCPTGMICLTTSICATPCSTAGGPPCPPPLRCTVFGYCQ